MRKAILFILLVIAGGTLSVSLAKHFWRGETMSMSEVQKRWGSKPLDIKKFKEGNDVVRASMAYSLLKKKEQFKGKFVVEIRQAFGNPDGFYFSDVFPAYLIYRGKTRDEDSWQIVFMLDNARKVSDIFVHKNCCD